MGGRMRGTTKYEPELNFIDAEQVLNNRHILWHSQKRYFLEAATTLSMCIFDSLSIPCIRV